MLLDKNQRLAKYQLEVLDVFRFAKPFFLICESSLHAGSGSDLGIVDLPIQRERHTGYPKVEASGIKGGIRESFNEYVTEVDKEDSENPEAAKDFVVSDSARDKFGEHSELWNEWELKEGTSQKRALKFHQAMSLSFGPEEGDLHAGALGFTDARILLFPVKTMKGVFAWITCKAVLERFKKDFLLADEDVLPELAALRVDGGNTLIPSSDLTISDKRIILEEFTFTAEENSNWGKITEWLADNIFPNNNSKENKYWNNRMKTKTVLLPDNDFRDFIEMSTEVVTRTKIDSSTGTVQSGALFTEEYLPTESVLYALALASPVFHQDKGVFASNTTDDIPDYEKVMSFLKKGIPDVIQLGGNATLGKGLIRIRFPSGGDRSDK